jgi:hypothetical protein
MKIDQYFELDENDLKDIILEVLAKKGLKPKDPPIITPFLEYPQERPFVILAFSSTTEFAFVFMETVMSPPCRGEVEPI